MKKVILGFAVLSIFLFSCKSENKKEQTVENSDNIEIGTPKVRTVDDVKPEKKNKLRSNAMDEINFRKQEVSSAPVKEITDQIWTYEFIYDGQTMKTPQAAKGEWIDFNEDLTYHYGVNSERKGSGIYHYTLDSGELFMLETSNNSPPQKWLAKVSGNVLILAGRPSMEYGNTYGQSKLVRTETKPNL